MPFHLQQISRRRFLRNAFLSGSGLALVPHLSASRKERDPNQWVLFSDTHLAADRGLEVKGVKMFQHFLQARDEVLALPRTPAGLILTGDCAYASGQPGDYALFCEELKPLRAALPIHLALGNHDDRANFLEAFPEAKRAPHAVSGREVSIVSTPLINWIILDSLEKTLSTPGLLGTDQLKWLGDTLDANPGKPALVIVHHNPGLNGGNMGLKDTMQFLEVLRPREQVKAYIYGHTHSWHIEQDTSGMHFINLPAVSYVFQEGEPSGWALATLKKGGMSLELHCLDKHHKLNGSAVELKWR